MPRRRSKLSPPSEDDAELHSPSGDPSALAQKITILDRVPGYVHRPDLIDRALPTRRRVTVLRATGGFGKTVLLAECCRQVSDDGVPVAWVSLDEHDTAAMLEGYIAAAFVQAGLSIRGVLEADEFAGLEGRIGVIVRAIQAQRGPFLLAFDELERLTDTASIALLAFVLQRGPPNLHLAFAGRRIPDGLNLAGWVFDGHAELLEADDLRFSRADISRFFDLGLSQRALSEEAERSAGWPVALRIARNGRQHGTNGDVDPHPLVANWIESRLFDGLAPDDRDFVLDLGQLEWFDAPLLDEVLEGTGSMRRLKSMTLLDGLFELAGAGAAHLRLHTTLRAFCARARLRESPERFRTIHRRIATALARRGDIVRAMRHAAEGDAPLLAGEIYERAGGVRLWTRHGVAQLQAADKLLAEETLAGRPRLRLARCAALALAGEHRQAQMLYSVSVSATRGSGEDFEFDVDDCLVRGAMAHYGCESMDSERMSATFRDSGRMARSPLLDAATRGHFEYALSVLHFLKGEFDSALRHLSVARNLLSGTHYIAFYGEVLRGQIDFVRGCPDDALSRLKRARQIARKHFLSDPVATTACAIAARELAMERNPAATASEPPGLRRALFSRGVPFSFFATAAAVCIDLRLRDGRVDEAVATADDLFARLRSAGTTGFLRLASALRASALMQAGRQDDAARAYREAALPEDAALCVDLEGQNWREMEAVSDARVRLLVANRRYEDARKLASEFCAVATARGFRRTRMRAVALSVMLEQQAREVDRSLARLQEYLRLFSESPYAWPLVRERATCATVLDRFLRLHPDSPDHQNARSLRRAMRQVNHANVLLLSVRERQTLALLPGRRVKQVAAELGLSVHGVRYHLRSLFAKLGASNRHELLRRAKEEGAIPHDP